MVNDTLPPEEKWEILQHEAAHHAGYGHSGNFTAWDAHYCAEEETDDTDPGGSGTEDDNPTCTTETMWVFGGYISCSSNNEGDATCNPQCLPGLNVCLEEVWILVEVTICDT